MKKSTIILSGALVIVLVVAIIFYSQTATLQSQNSNLQSQLQNANLNISTKANIFDTRFHDLLQEHTYLLIDTARRSLSNSSSSFNATQLALQNNINAVGNILTPIYGSNSSQLVNLWNQKANIFINYSNSLRNNDSNAMTYYNTMMNAYIPQVVTFWTTTQNQYPVINQSVITPLVNQNSIDVKGAIDAWYAGNYNTYYQDVNNSYFDMGTYADTIAQAIIQQNAQDFQ